MKKYYLHNGTESIGPFDFEELIAKKITPKTPVWFEGMENWKYASEVTELDSLFRVAPPSFESFSKKESTTSVEIEKEDKKILGLSKNLFLCIFLSLIVLSSTLIFNNLRENKIRELRVKNHKTEVENRQLELQQKEIEEQKQLEEAAQKAAEEKALENKKQAHKDRIIEIDQLIANSKTNLETATKALKNANNFKILRTPVEKNEELTMLQSKVDSILSEIDQLKMESNKLKLEIEKLP